MDTLQLSKYYTDSSKFNCRKKEMWEGEKRAPKFRWCRSSSCSQMSSLSGRNAIIIDTVPKAVRDWQAGRWGKGGRGTRILHHCRCVAGPKVARDFGARTIIVRIIIIAHLYPQMLDNGVAQPGACLAAAAVTVINVRRGGGADDPVPLIDVCRRPTAQPAADRRRRRFFVLAIIARHFVFVDYVSFLHDGAGHRDDVRFRRQEYRL